MCNLLVTEIDWAAEPVLARSLPKNILILNYPNGIDADDALFQQFMLSHFGANTTGFVGYDAERHLRRLAGQKRLTVEVTVWE